MATSRRHFLLLIAVSAMLAFAGSTVALRSGLLDVRSGWIRIFNGKNLEGWTAKIKGYELGVNYAETFRAADGVLRVSYDGYRAFDARFGHLFYKTPFSNYILRLEYRFVGDQVPEGPGWAFRNSGVMIHCPDPKTMRTEQDFPVSAEVQLLGGGADGERPTGNVCTPGTHIVIDGALVTRHCTDSNSPTYRGDQWVRLELEVHGHGRVEHRINGRAVLAYSSIQLDEGDPDARLRIVNGEKALSGGFIALQSESHPVEFRNIELLPLPR